MSTEIFMLRLFLACLMGMCIGIERELRGKGAGLRTHVLVCLTACLMMILSKYAFYDVLFHPDNQGALLRLDPSRIAAGIVTAIGFLGAGLIVVHPQLITGLTTSAGIWATVGVGMAVGAGMYWEAAATTVLAAFVNLISRFMDNKHRGQMVVQPLRDDLTSVACVERLKAHRFHHVRVQVCFAPDQGVTYTLTFSHRHSITAAGIRDLLGDDLKLLSATFD